MKFVCENCGSKYSISDDKVANKVLRIKCKKCGNIIKISDSKAKTSKSTVPPNAIDSVSIAPEPSTRPPSPPAPKRKEKSVLGDDFKASYRKKELPKPKGPPGLFDAVKRSAEAIDRDETTKSCWFVGIDGAPNGPVSAVGVRAFRSAGKVDDNSLVWKEGMVDWVPLRDLSELNNLLRRIDDKKESKPPKLHLFKDKAPSDISPLKDGILGVVSQRVAAEESERRIEDAFFSGTSSPAPGASGLAAKAAIPQITGIDIDGNVATLRSLVPPKPIGGMQNRMILIAAIGFFAVSLVTLGVALFGGDDSGSTQTSVKTVEKVIEKVVYLEKPAEDSLLSISDRPANRTGEADESAANRSAPVKTSSKSQQDKIKEQDAKTKELMERMGVAAPAGSGLNGLETRKQTSSSASTGSALTAVQVKAVVDKNKNDLKSCYERALKQGEAPDDRTIRVDFKMTVGASGMVKSVETSGEVSEIPSLQSCLKRSINKWIFPQGAQDSPIEFPFVFTPK